MESSEIGQEVNDENIDEDIKGPSPDQLWKWYTEVDSFFKVGSSWLFDYPEIDSSKFTDERRKIEGDDTNIYIWKKVYDAFYGLNEKSHERVMVYY
ncbi:MAG: hypothetical protein AYK19_17075 [Theionarchaea archaeon DG-70-1]|nr:MAG: hypothetical protein AYK19_17075 [Theionarchaea archaeon DG-70-1]